MCKIPNPSIFITSVGRTGTKFFAHLFDKVIPECNAFHEPGLVNFPSLRGLRWNLKHFPFRHVTIDKFRLSRNVRGLSLKRNAGTMSETDAAQVLYKLRQTFVNRLQPPLYVESNFQLVGLIDVLPQVFRNCRIVFIVRDGREWVKSSYSYGGGWYGPLHLIASLGIGRLSAVHCQEDAWTQKWSSFNSFQKNSWLWMRKNSYALECVKRTPQARTFKFEEIFLEPNRYETLREVLEFATNLPAAEFQYGPLEGVLERKLNKSQPGCFPSWTKWSSEQVAQFQEICRGLMSELGYGTEPEWRAMCRRAQNGKH